MEPCKENYLAFAKQNPSLEDFEKKLKSFRDVETQLNSMEQAKPIGMLLINSSALFPQVLLAPPSLFLRPNITCNSDLPSRAEIARHQFVFLHRRETKGALVIAVCFRACANVGRLKFCVTLLRGNQLIELARKWNVYYLSQLHVSAKERLERLMEQIRQGYKGLHRPVADIDALRHVMDTLTSITQQESGREASVLFL